MRSLGRDRMLFLASAALLASFISGCKEEAPPEELPEVPRNVRVLELQPTDLVEYLEISGPVSPVRSANVSAEEAGTVARVPHDKGDTVVKGGVLLELDRRLLAAELEANRANAELKNYNADKIAQLFEAGKVSQLDLLGAEAEAAGARSMLEVSRRRYERAAIEAPFGGIVADRFVEPGELVAPGMKVVRIIDPSILKLTGSLTEREVVCARVGAEVDVKLDGSERKVVGTVTWVGFEADLISGKFKVEIEIPNADLSLRSGVVGRARIERARHEGVLAIPRDAVISETGGDFVYVIEDDHAHRRPIQVGSDQGLMVQIESGLDFGAQLVVRGHRELVENSLVKITETTSNSDGSTSDDPTEIRDEDSRVRSMDDQEAGA